MSNEYISDDDVFDDNESIEEDALPPTTKLERRRLIEQLAEEKKLREELADFDF